MRCLKLGCVLAAFANCVGGDDTTKDSGSDGTVADSPSDSPSDAPVDASADVPCVTPPGGPHVYAVNYGAGALLVFDAPLTASSTPAAVVTGPFKNPSDVLLLGQTQLLVVDEGASKLFVFDLPIKSCSVPSAVVTLGFTAAVAAADVPQNNLFISGTGTVVQRFTLPLTSASTAAQTFSYPTEAGSPNAYGIAINPVHWVVLGTTGHIYSYMTPIDGGPPAVDNPNVPDPTGIALDISGALAVNAFVSDPLASAIQVFDGGINTNVKVPSLAGHSVVSSPQRLTLDDAGNLFVADSQKGIIVLSASSGYQLASVIVAAQGADAAIHNIRGVAIGP